MQQVISTYGLTRNDYDPSNKMDSPDYVKHYFDDSTGFVGINYMHAHLPEHAQIIGVSNRPFAGMLIAKSLPASIDPDISTVSHHPLVRREFMLVPNGTPFDGIEGVDILYIGEYTTISYSYYIFEILKPINYAQQPGNANTNS